MIRRLMLSLLFLVAALATATAQSVLFQVTGNGLSKPSYIFGLLHYLPKEQGAVPSEVQNALKACKVFSTETLQNHHTRHEMSKHSKLPHGETLEKYLSPEEYTALKKLMKEQLGVDEKTFELYYRHMRPLMLISAITRLSLGKDVVFLDDDLMKLAHTDKLKMAGLEPVEREVAAIDNYSITIQSRALAHFVITYKEHIYDYKELVKSYKTGDLERVYRLTLKPIIADIQFTEDFIHKRSEEWTSKMAELMTAEATFFAIGASHLYGERGLIELLKAKGYTLTAIPLP